MKKIALFLIFLSACRTSTEDRIKDSVSSILKQRFTRDKEKIEQFKIDSIRYNACDQAEFYSVKFDGILKADKSSYDLNGEIYDLYSTTRNDTGMAGALEAREAANREMMQIYDIIEKADTVEGYFEVDAHIIAKTDKESYNESRKIFLNRKDLAEVPFDSGKILGRK